MSKIRSLLLLCGLLAILVMPVFAQEATPTPFPGCGEFEYPTWTDADGSCTLKQTLTVETSFSYPDFVNDYPFAKAIVLQYLADRQLPFWSLLAEGFVQTNGAPWTLDISHEVHHFSDDVVSIIFTEYEYTGGAHPNTTFTTLTFDLLNEQQLLLSDLLVDPDSGLDTIAATVKEQLTNTVSDMSDASWIEQGAAPTPENYANFALTDEGLLIIFPPYQVAAYAAGAQMMTLPYSDLQGILKPEYLK